MIYINVTSKNKSIVELELKGHGQGLKGKDIICAAVSSISQSALLGILFYNKNGISWKKKSGYMKIRVEDKYDEKIQVILTSTIVGLKAISREFPDKVKINTNEMNKNP